MRSMIRRGHRTGLASLLGLLAAVGTGWAATIGAAARSGGASWAPPFDPASPFVVVGLQGLLRTEAGSALLSESPSLGVLQRLDPHSRFDRQVVGAMAAQLPEGFEARLRSALKSPHKDPALAASLAQEVASAQRAAIPIVGPLVRTRAEEIAAAVTQGGMSPQDLIAASKALSKLSMYGSGAMEHTKAVAGMAREARLHKTMRSARELASRLSVLHVQEGPERAVEPPAAATRRTVVVSADGFVRAQDPEQVGTWGNRAAMGVLFPIPEDIPVVGGRIEFVFYLPRSRRVVDGFVIQGDYYWAQHFRDGLLHLRTDHGREAFGSYVRHPGPNGELLVASIDVPDAAGADGAKSASRVGLARASMRDHIRAVEARARVAQLDKLLWIKFGSSSVAQEPGGSRPWRMFPAAGIAAILSSLAAASLEAPFIAALLIGAVVFAVLASTGLLLGYLGPRR